MVLAPGNSFGQRVSDAFIKQWQQLTGNTPAQRQFSSRQQIQKEIASVFGLTDSQARIDQMKQILGNNSLEGQPRSRRDTDAVYMIANINELTLLKPFIDVAVNPGVKHLACTPARAATRTVTSIPWTSVASSSAISRYW